MQIKKKQIKKTQTRRAFGLGVLLAVCPASAAPAQAKPLSAKPATTASSTAGATGVSISAPLLSSPFLSAAVKAQILKEAEEEEEAYAAVKAGNNLAKNGHWKDAQSQYRQALDASPEHGSAHLLALYGLIACCRATGDTARGLDYSRQAIYRHGSAAEGFFENNPEPLMQFALLLNQMGQAPEAVTAYNHAASLLDFQDSQYNGGKSHLKALLPELVAERTLPAQVRYTPERLQALAETAIAHEEMAFGSNKEALTHMQEAVKLYPDSPVTNYYLGEALLAKDRAGAKAAYQKAAQLGDDQTIAAAKERIGMCR